MKPLYRGIAAGALQCLLVLSVFGKYALDRERLPRVWAKAAPVDPSLPVRGRYVSLRLEVDSALETQSIGLGHLTVRGGRLAVVDDGAPAEASSHVRVLQHRRAVDAVRAGGVFPARARRRSIPGAEREGVVGGGECAAQGSAAADSAGGAVAGAKILHGRPAQRVIPKAWHGACWKGLEDSTMRKWLWITPIVLLAACSRNQASNTQAKTPPGTLQAATTAPAPNPPAPAPATPAPTTEAPATGTPMAAAPAAAESPAPEAPPPAPVRAMVIPRGTALRVRVDETLSTRRNLRGDRFSATLVRPVTVDGEIVLPVGTRLSGHVIAASPSGRLKGRARLVLALDSFVREGRRYAITTTVAARVSKSHKKRNILAIGGSAGGGAAIGAIAGGGLGAAIGAGAGAAAGTVGAAITGRKQVTLPAESVVGFTLESAVRV